MSESDFEIEGKHTTLKYPMSSFLIKKCYSTMEIEKAKRYIFAKITSISKN